MEEQINNIEELVIEQDTDRDFTQEEIDLINAHNDRIIRSPEYQATVIYENYIRNDNSYMDGPAKKRLRKEILRNAKKGRYKKIFTEEYIEETKRVALEELREYRNSLKK